MSSRAYTASEDSLVHLEHVAVAITVLPERPGQHHVGILHKNESVPEICLLHLAWHNELKNSRPKPTYLWVTPPIPKERARQVAAFCRRVYKVNPSGIPYAFSSASDCFDKQTGEFMAGPNRYGLTCATFVLGVFHSVGLPLVQYATWPKTREGDNEWQRHIIEQLKENGASPEHISHVQSEVGAVRFRPEDVAGASAADSIPTPFEVANGLAEAILAKLKDPGNPAEAGLGD